MGEWRKDRIFVCCYTQIDFCFCVLGYVGETWV